MRIVSPLIAALPISKKCLDNIPLKNLHQGMVWNAPISVEGQWLNVDLDTGSSDTWFTGAGCVDDNGGNCQGMEVDVSSMSPWNISFGVQYGSGWVNGNVFNATVMLGHVSAVDLPIGVVTKESSMSGIGDGLVGLAFDSIGEISNKVGQNANFIDSSGLDVFAFYLSRNNSELGELTLGGVDKEKFTGNISFVELNSETYWQFSLQNSSFEIGNYSGKLSGNAIVDTGTSLLLLENKVAKRINLEIGGKFDSDEGVFMMPCNMTFPDVSFMINGQELRLSSEVYILRAGDRCFSGILPRGNTKVSIFGDVFMREWYTIFDRKNKIIGFAKSQ